MIREDKITDIQKDMIIKQGSNLDDYIPVRIYTIKPDGTKIEDQYMIFSKIKTKTSSCQDFFFDKMPITFPSGDSYFFDDPELKIEENGESYSLSLSTYRKRIRSYE